jgi:hypothetical protein
MRADDAGESEREVDAEPEKISADELFHLLQNRRRRDVLRYLRGSDGQVRMRDIAEQVAAWEHDKEVSQLRSKERQRVYIALYQEHLPKLDEAGVIVYNKSRGIVKRTERADEFEPYLAADTTDEQGDDDAGARVTLPWEQYSLGLSGVGAGLLLTTVLGGSALEQVTTIGAVALISLAVLVAMTNVRGGTDAERRNGSATE